MNTTLDLGNIKAGLSKRTIREQVGQRIAAMVQSGLLRAGDELPSERDLASTLEVSRETVRGAIQMLAAVGMVEISQGSRTRVTGTVDFRLGDRAWGGGPKRSAQEVYEARRLVELPIVRLAVERIDATGVLRLKRLVEAQREMTGDPVRFQISDAEFHDVIYRAGGNPLLADFLHEMYSFGLEFRRKVLLGDNAVRRSVEDHLRIVTAFEQGNQAAAVEAMDRHLDRIHRTTLDVMNSYSGTGSVLSPKP
jgi:DNA-binding FadR family transcriptional regulator